MSYHDEDGPSLVGYLIWVFLILALVWLANRYTTEQPRDPGAGTRIPAEVHGTLE